jgi:hypothetical protein
MNCLGCHGYDYPIGVLAILVSGTSTLAELVMGLCPSHGAAFHDLVADLQAQRVQRAREERDQRRPYTKPTLTTYGTLTKRTRAVGNMGSRDGGTGNTSKTA